MIVINAHNMRRMYCTFLCKFQLCVVYIAITILLLSNSVYMPFYGHMGKPVFGWSGVICVYVSFVAFTLSHVLWIK